MISTKDTPCPQCGSIPKCDCHVPTLLELAGEYEKQAAEQMAKAAIPQGSRPADITRDQQDLVNLAGDNRVSAHRIRQAIKWRKNP